MSDPIVGIDLGTSNSVVAHVGVAGTPVVLADESGVKVHPSVVSFHPNGGVVVGSAAKQRKVIDPKNTIYSVKRLIGRSFGAREVQTAKGRVPYAIKLGPNQQPIISTRAGDFAVPEVSAIVLDHVKNVASAALGEPVKRAVVTVPASFNDAQRSATATAGAIAGLEVMRVINEPTAAALAYGNTRDLREVIAVYDFGGGTFDITILKLADQVYEVLGTAGDTFLGGDDFDERLVERMAEKFLSENRMDLRTNEVAMMRLRAVAEQTKIELSRRSRAVVRIDEIAYGPKGRPLDLQIEVTRDEFVRLCADIVDRTFPVCREALTFAQLGTNQIDHVVLVGGSTRIPYVRDQVAKFFGKPPRTDVNPDDAVATGAALQAAALQQAVPTVAADEISAATLVADVELAASGPAEYPMLPREEREPAKRRNTAGYGIYMETERPAERGGHHDAFGGDTPTRPDTSVPAAPIGRLTRTNTAPMVAKATPTSLGMPPLPPGGVPQMRLPPTGEMGNAPTQVPTRPAPAPPVTGEVGNAPTQVPTGRATRQRSSSASPIAPIAPLPPFAANAQSRATAPARAIAPPKVSMPTEPTAELDPTTAAWLAEQSLDTDLETMQPIAELELEPFVTTRSAPSQAKTLVVESPVATMRSAPPPITPAPSPAAAAPPPAAPPMAANARTMIAPATPPPAANARTMIAPATPPPAPPPSARTTMIAPAPPAPAPLELDHLDAMIAESQVAPIPLPVHAHAPAPVVLDVTPRGLGIATVAGFCEELIRRNSRVPAETRKLFTTSRDGQDTVRIVICQGESRRLGENVVLGDLLLQGIAPRPRGETTIEVTFVMDASGILQVSARDAHTGVEQRASLDLVGAMPQQDVAASRERVQHLRK